MENTKRVVGKLRSNYLVRKVYVLQVQMFRKHTSIFNEPRWASEQLSKTTIYKSILILALNVIGNPQNKAEISPTQIYLFHFGISIVAPFPIFHFWRLSIVPLFIRYASLFLDLSLLPPVFVPSNILGVFITVFVVLET